MFCYHVLVSISCGVCFATVSRGVQNRIASCSACRLCAVGVVMKCVDELGGFAMCRMSFCQSGNNRQREGQFLYVPYVVLGCRKLERAVYGCSWMSYVKLC